MIMLEPEIDRADHMQGRSSDKLAKICAQQRRLIGQAVKIVLKSAVKYAE